MDEPTLDPPVDPRRRFVLVRFVLLRLLGLVYLAAFVGAAREAPALIGPRGLLPADRLLEAAVAAEGSRWAVLRRLPSVFVVTGASDAALLAAAWLGIALATAVLAGATNAGVLLALWTLQLSLVGVGQSFWGFGWEIQLLETGMLAVFLCPWRTIRPFSPHPPPTVAIWLLRWLVVRIMLGAGLIKLRGDPCWVELTCLVHHYETQPNPSPGSFLLHAMPRWFHQAGVVVNHVVELVLPAAAFGPRAARLVAGTGFVAFQALLIASGNLSFLNWLTIVPALACLDDAALARVLPRWLVTMAERGTTERAASRPAQLASIGWAIVVGVLSLQPVANLLSPRQVMNRGYDPLYLVNTYGAFGAVGAEREEIVIEGTRDETPDDDADWREYALPCKPGPVDRRPCQVTPFHLRLDWQAWFLPFGDAEDAPWFIHLVAKLLEGDATPKPLLAEDPFPDAPPRWIRATRHRYRMVPYGEEPGVWWRREPLGPFLRPVARDDPQLDAYLRAAGWRP